ncbi:hypothetical protein BGZ54_003491 [Gamsiella multidivaricata]|nr:hypothetical protein BGZ54_003491 [Gamsiella multidivaricata]
MAYPTIDSLTPSIHLLNSSQAAKKIASDTSRALCIRGQRTIPSSIIFDLPPIMKTICSHLSNVDIWRYRAVSRTWCVLFEPYRWEYVKWHSLEGTRVKQLLIENATRVQHLTISNSRKDAQQELRGFINLKSLHLVSRPPGEDVSTREEYMRSSWDLIRDNPGLWTLRLDFTRGIVAQLFCHCDHLDHLDLDEPLHQTSDSALAALKRHPSLRSVTLTIAIDRVDVSASFLRHLPTATLQHLAIEVACSLSGDSIGKPTTTSAPIVNNSSVWPTFPLLRQLNFGANLARAEDLIVFPLLQSCPNVIDLMLPKVKYEKTSSVIDAVIKHCPNLQILDLRCLDIDESEILRLVEPYTQLRELYLGRFMNSRECVLTAVLDQCAKTLEVIDVPIKAGVMKMDEAATALSRTLGRALAGCPRLRELKVHEDWLCEDNAIPISDLVHASWASSQIEHLRAEFGQWDEALTVGEFVDIVARLHGFLSAQSRLKCLYLKWTIPENWDRRKVKNALRAAGMDAISLKWIGLKI